MMQPIDISGKISRPRLHAVFKRTCLFDLIDEYRSHPVIWISGLPGAGKSTLAASYIEDRGLPCLWYQMNKGDDDPASFFYYLDMAVKKVSPRRNRQLSTFSHEHFSNLDYFAAQHFRGLFGLMKKPSIMVLDNYQDVPSDSRLHDIIGAAMEEAPPEINIIVLSRAGPPPALARLILNKVMMIMRPEELSLTHEESIGIASLLDRWKSSLEFVPKFLQYTDGWAAGLVLMLEYGKPGSEVSGSPNVMAKEAFFNYFAGEIFDKMDPVIQKFLIKTACLPNFTPASARKLTGVSQAARILTEMNRKNYFTEKKGQDVTVYQYHPLFREFLLSRAEEELISPQLMEVYRKAACLLAEEGRLEDAFALYSKSGELKSQISLILRHAPTLIAQRRLGILEQWLKSLPPEVVCADPWLLYWSGQCRLPFDPLESRILFARALEKFKLLGDSYGFVLTVSGAVEAILTEWGDFRQMDPWIEELDALLKDAKPFSAPEIEARAVFAMFSALMFRRPQHPDLGSWADRMMALIRSRLDNNLRLLLGGYLSHYRSWMGDIAGFRLVVDMMGEIMKTSEPAPLVFMTWKMQEAVYFWHVARFDDCLAAVREGLLEAEKSGVHVIDNWLLAQAVYASLSRGELEQAGKFLDQMKPILNTRRYLDISHYHYLNGLYHLQSGDMSLALEFSKAGLELARQAGTPFPEGLNCVSVARILHEAGETGKAEGPNARALDIGSAMNSPYLEMMSYLNESYFALKGPGDEKINSPLRKAMTIAKKKGLVNFAGWDQSMMTRLCIKALEAGLEVEYVQNLVRRRNMLPEAAPCDGWPWQLRIYTLGRFELIVEGEPLRFAGKPQFKPLEMLKVLVALGGKGVSQDRLEDLLWPDAEGERGRQALVTTLHRLRKLLGNEKIIELSERRFTLNDSYCWIDVWALDNLFNRIENALGQRVVENEISTLTDRLLDLYRGNFLKDEPNAPWIWSARERLRSRFLQGLGKLGRSWEEQRNYEKATEVYLKALDIDDLTEEFYQRLMECHHRQGRKAEALAIYERCRRVLSSSLGIRPSAETESIRKFIRDHSES
jgi:DNA-binding SARP family transcriptional activator